MHPDSLWGVGHLSLFLAVCALAASLFPAWMFVAMGVGGFSLVLGIVGYRDRQAPPWARIAGAAGITLASLALFLSLGRFALTWWAIGKLGQMLA